MKKTDKNPPKNVLASLVDERLIRQQLARFARMLDQRNWSAVAEIFAKDVLFDYGEGEKSGIKLLTETFRKYLDPCGPTQHLIGSIAIEIPGEFATSSAYVQARHLSKDGSSYRDSNGEYKDFWRKHSKGWLIVERRVEWPISIGDPDFFNYAD